jgi:hypothetical protein
VNRRIVATMALGVAGSILLNLVVFDEHVLRAVVTPVMVFGGVTLGLLLVLRRDEASGAATADDPASERGARS